ncbi:hypothetical protein ACHHYP_02165 [Achlya hypogyna]|uniref:Secreted protein n=1 Tax=Achlya hypogyna TaxID=1202772 RepID=A0A1V9ZSA6_ACHHY|nr:hypothetical protein ACHHYP_02165 [Achlya hypogyna]
MYDVPRGLPVLLLCVGFLVLAGASTKPPMEASCPRLALYEPAPAVVCQHAITDLNMSLAKASDTPPVKKKKKKTKTAPDKDLAFKLLLLGLFLMVVTTLF